MSKLIGKLEVTRGWSNYSLRENRVFVCAGPGVFGYGVTPEQAFETMGGQYPRTKREREKLRKSCLMWRLPAGVTHYTFTGAGVAWDFGSEEANKAKFGVQADVVVWNGEDWSIEEDAP